ncbi:GH92 family glycosyl hydrolase [soil metagenome]
MKVIAFAVLVFFTTSAFTQDYTKFVNPFIGTGGHGHTYPGAIVPHGMVQLSPDTRLDGWDGCSGYHYSDKYIYGFTHTHLSGTGCSDYGDILLMPMMRHPSPDNKIYGSTFLHNEEKASPGYYAVLLKKDNIQVELTTTERTGMHRYTFPKAGDASVILDLKHRDEVITSTLLIEDSVTISGLRRSRGWAVDQYVYFVIKFSKPFIKTGIYNNDSLVNNIRQEESKNLKAFFTFNVNRNEQIIVKVALSAVSVEGAKKNLNTELTDWNFDHIKSAAQHKWNTELNKIKVEDDNTNNKTIFYTALYHTMVAPNISNDVDGQYRGRDNKIHTAKGFTYYSVFSLWDTYRAAHPLYTIIDQSRTVDYIKTFLAQYKEGGRLPVWELSSNETDCMIGYHSVPVIVDAALKGIDGFDKELALEAMKKSAEWNHYGLSALMDHGYIEVSDESESVSKNLEYAYDDWCIAQFAKSIGKEGDYITYIKRSQSYKNLLDVRTGFMRPKINGNWITPFDPREVNNNFTEANSWQYTFYVPHDMTGYMNMVGGKKILKKKLDSLFTVSSKTTGRKQEDITGLIGQYAHGNEPSHHIAYLYNFVGKPSKTQQKVHRILTTMYRNTPDGLEGNEDCGQMSAWYVLSALGFYPVTPGSSQYIVGAPLFQKATIYPEKGRSFSITAKNISARNIYPQSATINNINFNAGYLNHTTIMKGGDMIFIMGAKPSDFATTDIPVTSVADNIIVLNPVIKGGDVSFSGEQKISISAERRTKIYYTTDGSLPTASEAMLYKEPFMISTDVTLKAIALNAEGNTSALTTSKYHHKNNNFSVIVKTPFEPEYTAGGPSALTDELFGTTDWRKGNWQGYQKVDPEIIIDLKKNTAVSQIVVGLLQDTRSWIIMPKEIVFEISDNGIKYTPLFKRNNFLPVEDMKVQVVRVSTSISPAVFGRYIKMKATQFGKLPEWHPGAGSESHIFIDEIQIH